MFRVLWIIGLFVLNFNILETLCQKEKNAAEVNSYKFNEVCDKLLHRLMRQLRKKSSTGKKEVLQYTTPVKLPDGSQIQGINVYNVSRWVRRTMKNCTANMGDPVHIQIPFEIPRLQFSAFFYPKGKSPFLIGWIFGQIEGYLEVQFYKKGTFVDAKGSNINNMRIPDTKPMEKASEVFDITAEQAHRKFFTETINKLQADFDYEKLLNKFTEFFLEKIKPVLKSFNWKEWYETS